MCLFFNGSKMLKCLLIQLGRLKKIIDLLLLYRKWFVLDGSTLVNKELATLGITGLFSLRVHIDEKDWHLDVGLKYLWDVAVLIVGLFNL